MDPDRWKRLRELFDAALALPTSERSAFVARSCGDDSELRASLESLIEHSLDSGASFERAFAEAVEPAERVSADLSGRMLGRYRVAEKIGEGGMGVVYRATDVDLARDVAIKILPAHLEADPERLARFQREAQALAALHHPGIATIHGIESAEGIRFLVMELVEGETLRDRLERGPLPVETVVDLAEQIAEGLAQAHAAKMVHRDLKPGNVMLTGDGRTKILDFGLAKTVAEPGESGSSPSDGLETQTGRILGTTAYMSPEQARGETVDARSDQFAFGAMLLEMATGQRAFRRNSDADTLSAILHEEPDLPADFEARVPSSLRQIIGRCLAKRREDRYPSTAELIDDLRAMATQLATEDQPTVARGVSGTETVAPSAPWTKRIVVGLFGVGLVAVLSWQLALYLGFDSSRTSGEEPPDPAELVARAVREAESAESASIAVLPLENLGPSGEEYFADGMTDALITDLSKIAALKVISRTSVMQFKGTRVPLPEIARGLGVDKVLTGTVLHAGGRVRISVQLTEASTDENLWAESYERGLQDVLALQSEVAAAVAGAVRVEIAPEERARILRTKKIDPEAHDAYLRGLARIEEASSGNAASLQPVQASFREFQRAIDMEPGWAQPRAQLAGAYAWLANSSGPAVQAEYYPRAKAAAQRALELDETEAMAHLVLGRVLFFHEWDWAAAESAFERARELGGEGLWGWARYLVFAQRWDEAIAEYLEILERHPSSSLFPYQLGKVYLCGGRLDEAETAARSLIRSGEKRLGELLLAEVLLRRGDFEEARNTLEGPLDYWADLRPWMVGLLPYAQARSGRREEALETVRELEERGFDWFPSAYVALGEEEKAMAQIETAFEVRRDILLTLPCSLEFDRLMELPRFREIVDAIGFPGLEPR